MCEFPIQGEGLHGAARLQENGAARSLVAAAGFHAHVTVLHHVHPPDAVPAAQFVQPGQQGGRSEGRAVQGHRVTVLKLHIQGFRLIRCFRERTRVFPHVFFRRLPGVFQRPPFVGGMQEIGVHGVGRAAAPQSLDGNAAPLGIGEQLLPGVQVPFPPGGDDTQPGMQGGGTQFKAYLVVPLAGGAVRDGVRTQFTRYLHHAQRDERPRDGGAEQIGAFVKRVGAQQGEHVVAHEQLAQIFDEDALHTELFRFTARRLQVFLLSQVGGESDDFAGEFFPQP